MIKFFLDKYPAIFVFAFLIIIMGVISYKGLPKESAPEIKVPMIFITTVYPGVSAKDMENLVTQQIEDEIEGLDGLTKINSSSMQSVSSIVVEFSADTEVETALRRVRERVDIAKADLPDDVDEPMVQELSSSDWPILIVVLSHASGIEVLNETVDFLEEEIKRVRGVQEVKISGKLEKEVAIEVDPARLAHYGFSLDDIIKAITTENVSIPGGILKNPAKNYSLSVSGEVKNPEVFKDILVSNKGVKVRLGALADVAFKYKEPETISRLNGKPAISLAITKRSGENIVQLVDGVKTMINENENNILPGTSIFFSFDESRAIKDMVADLENNIITALVLVFTVTLLFLGLVNSLFVCMAIPFSMLISFIVLSLLDITLNMVVLFSLILALGMLVDNGIVIVENIYRHATMGKSRYQAAIDGSKEVAWPIITSTLTTVLAFTPIIFMPDIMGEFMSYIPKTVIIVLCASLAVALSINPVFCSKFLRLTESQRRKAVEGGAVFSRLQSKYEGFLNFVLDRPFIYLTLVTLIVIAGMILNGAFGKGSEFFPNIPPQAAAISYEAPHGQPLEKTNAALKSLESIVKLKKGGVEQIQTTAGQSAANEMGGTSKESHYGNIRVGYYPYMERDIDSRHHLLEMAERAKPFTGAEIKVKKQEHGPPQGHPISYEITGQNYQVLGSLADSLLGIIGGFKEHFELIDCDFEKAKPQINININREKAAQYGLSTMQIASTIRNAMSGGEISKMRQGSEEYDVMVRYKANYRNDINQLKTLEIMHEGDRIPLGSVAEITDGVDVAVIKRKNLKRTVEVYADFIPGTQGQDRIKADIKSKIEKVNVPAGYRIGTGEGAKMQEDAETFLMNAFLAALFMIFIVLIIQFNSITQPFMILFAVVLSLGGVFWGLFLAQQTFIVIMTGVGIISLAGVVVNNCIVLIDYINKLIINEGYQVRDAIIEGGKTRLRPVLLTAITTILGLVPMAVGISFDFFSFTLVLDSESTLWWKSMAWAVIFGLSFATVLTLVVIPIFIYLDYKSRLFIKKLLKNHFGYDFDKPRNIG